MSKIAPCIWYAKEAEEAAKFYTSLIPNSRIEAIHHYPSDMPGGKIGEVMLVEFTLAGQRFQGLNGGQKFEHSYAISFSIECEDQAEVDRLWEALAEGGKHEVCGWLKDRYGVSWQIVPKIVPKLLATSDAAQSKRVMDAIMGMTKIDIAALQRAYDGA